MSIGIHSLSAQLRGLVDGAYPNFGQTFFVVDSDFRTQAQGWSKADGTGPLDLAEERRAGKGGVGYVFRTGDYTSDAACLQAAHDAAVSFRGDAVFLTPGALSIGTVVNWTTAGTRLLGPVTNAPNQARATVTAAVDAALSIAATAVDMELGFLKLVPLAESSFADVTGAANRGHWHHFIWDQNGITAANTTGANMIDFLGAALDWSFQDFTIYSDSAQTAMIQANGTVKRLSINRFKHLHAGGTSAVSLLEVVSTAATGLDIGPGVGICAGATAAVTALVSLADNAVNTSNGVLYDFNGSSYAAVGTLVATAGATGEFQMINCRFGTVQSAATTTALYIVGSLYTS